MKRKDQKMIERSFVMIKPDGVHRGLIGEIISRFERRGIKIVAAKMMRIQKELAERHYSEHKGKSFFEGLVEYVTSSPVICLVLEGANVISVARVMTGMTNPQDAAPGTIRGDFAMQTGRNVIHASDSSESAKREIELFFNDYEIHKYERVDAPWLYE